MEVYFMASEVLLNELRSIEEELEKSNKKVTDENAFEYLAMQFFCYKIKSIEPKICRQFHIIYVIFKQKM